jgi:hypothetical protein
MSVLNQDPDLNILIKSATFKNKSIEEFLITGYKFPRKSLSVLPAIYTFNFFNQKQVGAFFNSTILGVYLETIGFPENRMRYFFEKDLQKEFRKFATPWNRKFDEDIRNVNLSEIFVSLFSHLWHSKLPCYDLIGISGMEDNDSSFVKNCIWKGVSISCAALFKKVPTDRGMCCAFNSDMADTMYVDSLFSKTIMTLQALDKNWSFSSVDLPSWYIYSQEPRSKPGLTMGLQVTLDGHNDLLGAYSIDSPYDSFQAMVLPSGDFPLISQSGFRLQRGFHNLIALSATIIQADDSLRSIEPKNRGCLYPNERPLKLFQKYSQSNCIFECLLSEVQEKVKETLRFNTSCYPWYFPFVDDELQTCDPKTSNIFETLWQKSNRSCDFCMPDCNTNVYKYSLSQEPIRSCDDFNVGVSPLCNLQHRSNIYKPFLWGHQVSSQLGISNINARFISETSNNNIRNVTSMFGVGDIPIFTNTRTFYDAYNRDIATVSVFFPNPTVWMFTTTASSSWIAYISNVGGLLGLCIGISFSTVIELVWLVIRFCVEGNLRGKVKSMWQKLDNHEDESIESIDIEQAPSHEEPQSCSGDLNDQPNENKE